MKKILNKKNIITITRNSKSSSCVVVKKNNHLTKEEEYLIKNVGNAIKRLSNT